MRKWLQRRLWALSYRLRDWSEWLDDRAWALTPPKIGPIDPDNERRVDMMTRIAHLDHL